MPRPSKSPLIVAGAGLGLALGAALGVFVLSPNMSGSSTETAAISDSEAASADVENAQHQAEIAQREADAADEVVQATGLSSLDGLLAEQPVLIVRTADADDDDVARTRGAVSLAGAIDSGEITLTDKFLSQDGADELKTIVTNTLPAGTELSEEQRDPGTHAGQALGAALTFGEGDTPNSSTEDRGLLLSTLAEAGYIQYDAGTILPGQAVVVITGDDDGERTQESGYGATVLSQFVRALDEQGGATVLAGRAGAAEPNGALGVLRSDDEASSTVSTVDAIDSTWGRIASTMAIAEQLDGGSGAYGYASSAQQAFPNQESDDGQ